LGYTLKQEPNPATSTHFGNIESARGTLNTLCSSCSIMNNSKILLWVGCFFAGIVTWRLTDILLASVGSSQLLPWLMLPIFLVVLNEVVAKIAIFAVLSTKEHVSTSVREWPQIDHQKLEAYTEELEALGFKKLIDFKYENEEHMTRLFSKPDQSCFAEVAQLKNQPMGLNILTAWDEGWTLNVNNIDIDPKTEGVGRVFLRRPGDISKNMPNASAKQMYTKFISMRDRVNSRMQIQPKRIKASKDYFAIIETRKAAQRKALLHKSMILAQIQLKFSSAKPSPDYFGKDVIKASIF
jgi:hypothetical protein